MTDIDWYSEPDLLRRLVLPRCFPRDKMGLPLPHELGMSHRELVKRYLPVEGRHLIGFEQEVVRIEGKYQIREISLCWKDRAMERRG